MKNYIEDFDEFVRLTGLLDEEQIDALKLKPLIGLEQMWYDEDGGIDANSNTLNALVKFINTNPDYHIISRTEGDHNSDCYSNQIRYVNRMKYYIGKGSTKEMEFVDLDTIEIEEESG